MIHLGRRRTKKNKLRESRKAKFGSGDSSHLEVRLTLQEGL